MKFYLSLPLILLLAILTSCSRGSDDLVKYGLKGNVKKVQELQCSPTYENEHWVASSKCDQGFRVVEFDEEGNYLRSMTIAERGDTLAMTVAKRENGELVEEIYYGRENMIPKHSRLVPISRTIQDRVSDKQVNFEIWQSDQLRYEGATYYDSKGRVDRQVQVVNNREVMVHNVYDKDLLVEIYQVESNGSRSATQQYEYGDFDKKGNWTLRLVYLGEEKITPELSITRVIEYR
jgi:hypothetical protein